MKGGTQMGYFKNLEIELQEIHDEELREIVAWHRAHKNLMTPEELWAVMTDEVKLKRAIVLWENSKRLPAPKPATDHVALQVKRRDLRPKRNRVCVLGWSMIAVALATGVTVLVVNL
jgi:hypothetical protein